MKTHFLHHIYVFTANECKGIYLSINDKVLIRIQTKYFVLQLNERLLLVLRTSFALLGPCIWV